MVDNQKITQLAARVEFLEREAMKRAPDQTLNQMLIMILWTWIFERNREMDFDAIAAELRTSIRSLPVPGAPADKAATIRATLSASLDEFLTTTREKVQEARERDQCSGK